jgi:hypothetical protein
MVFIIIILYEVALRFPSDFWWLKTLYALLTVAYEISIDWRNTLSPVLIINDGILELKIAEVK